MNPIYIPTRGRATTQYTLAAMPLSLHDRIVLVVSHAERAKYQAQSYPVRILATPKHVTGISATRAWIADQASKTSPAFYMFDDDMKFIRRSGDGVRLRQIRDYELVDLFATLDDWLTCKGVGMVGVSSRPDNWLVPAPHAYLGRAINAYGYRSDVASRVTWGRVEFYEDHDITMQILRMGYATKINYEFAWQPMIPPQTNGGCSLYRNPANETEAVRKVYALHQPYTTLKAGVASRRFDGATIDAVHFKRKAAYLSGLPVCLR